MLYAYPIVLQPDDNGTLLVTCPDLPEVTTFGEDEADARLRARDAIEEAIAARIARRDDIPAPSLRQGPLSAPLSEQTMLKATLWREMRRAGIKKAELARRLGWSGPQVDRLFDLNHASRLDQLDAAFAALGLKVGPFVLAEPSDQLASLPLDKLVESVESPAKVWDEFVRRHHIAQETQRMLLLSMYRSPGQEIAVTSTDLDKLEQAQTTLNAVKESMDQFLDRHVPGRKPARTNAR